MEREGRKGGVFKVVDGHSHNLIGIIIRLLLLGFESYSMRVAVIGGKHLYVLVYYYYSQ